MRHIALLGLLILGCAEADPYAGLDLATCPLEPGAVVRGREAGGATVTVPLGTGVGGGGIIGLNDLGRAVVLDDTGRRPDREITIRMQSGRHAGAIGRVPRQEVRPVRD